MTLLQPRGHCTQNPHNRTPADELPFLVLDIQSPFLQVGGTRSALKHRNDPGQYV